MILFKKELINLPVYTQSNQHLGKVTDFELDASSQTIIRYHVKGAGFIPELLQKELLVSKEQVISVTKEKMVVEDLTVSSAEIKKEALKEVAPAN